MAACRPQLSIATGDFDQSLDPRGRPASWRPARLQLLARSARKRNLRSLGLVMARPKGLEHGKIASIKFMSCQKKSRRAPLLRGADFCHVGLALIQGISSPSSAPTLHSSLSSGLLPSDPNSIVIMVCLRE